MADSSGSCPSCTSPAPCGKCKLFRCVFALVIAGLLTCIATGLWQIEGHIATIAASAKK